MRSGYILFPTTAGAFAAEKILKSLGIKVKLVSTPRFLSSSCGISAYFTDSDPLEVKNALDTSDIDFKIEPYVDEYLEKTIKS